MAEVDLQERLARVAGRANRAERLGNDAAANAEWRRYRLIRDANRNPDELLAEGVELSDLAAELAATIR